MRSLKLIGATGGVLALAAVSTTLPAAAGDSSAVSLEEMLPLIAVPQVGSDHVPAEVKLDELGGISARSVRSAGSDDAAHYWVGRTEASEICLIMQLVDEPEMSASTCAPITEFYRKGLSLVAGTNAENPGNAAEAYLLPSDVRVPGASNDHASVRHQAERGLSPTSRVNLVSGRSAQLDGLKNAEVHRGNGGTFHFRPISLNGE